MELIDVKKYRQKQNSMYIPFMWQSLMLTLLQSLQRISPIACKYSPWAFTATLAYSFGALSKHTVW